MKVENSHGESVYSWSFDFNKPRNDDGRATAIKAYAKYKGLKPNDPKLRGKPVHHIDLNRSEGKPSNLFVVRDNAQHTKLHGQLQAMNSFLIKHGYLAFDRFKKFYYAQDQRLKDIFEEISIKEKNRAKGQELARKDSMSLV